VFAITTSKDKILGFAPLLFTSRSEDSDSFLMGWEKKKERRKVFPDKERLLTFSVTTLYIFLKMEIRIHHALNILK